MIQRFSKRDDDYRSWREGHADGYVANIVESDHSESRIHRASCWTLENPVNEGKALTEDYPKICSEDLAELRSATGSPKSCAHCSPMPPR